MILPNAPTEQAGAPDGECWAGRVHWEFSFGCASSCSLAPPPRRHSQPRHLPITHHTSLWESYGYHLPVAGSFHRRGPI